MSKIKLEKQLKQAGEIEQDRLDILNGKTVSDKQFGPNSYGEIEAIERIYIVLQMMGNLEDHPSILRDPYLYVQTRQISDKIADLYQRINEKSFDEYEKIKNHKKSIVQKLEKLRKEECQGPCGQSSSVLKRRSEKNELFKEIMEALK